MITKQLASGIAVSAFLVGIIIGWGVHPNYTEDITASPIYIQLEKDYNKAYGIAERSLHRESDLNDDMDKYKEMLSDTNEEAEYWRKENKESQRTIKNLLEYED